MCHNLIKHSDTVSMPNSIFVRLLSYTGKVTSSGVPLTLTQKVTIPDIDRDDCLESDFSYLFKPIQVNSLYYLNTGHDRLFSHFL
jgi:hypothetical protein